MLNRRQFGTVIGAAVGAAMLPRSAFAQSANLDVATILPEANFHTRNVTAYGARVAKATEGRVAFTVHAGGGLGFKGPDLLRAVRDGLVPVGDILCSQQVGDEPMFGVESLPFLITDADQLKMLHKYLRPKLEDIAVTNNQNILYMVPWPTQYFHLKNKVETIEDLKGVRVRVSDKNAQDLCAALGMAPSVIPWGETLPALASGAIDGVVTSSVSGVDGRLWEFVKYVHPSNHTWTSQMVNMNLDTLRGFSDADQQAIVSIGREMEPDFWAGTVKEDEDSLATLQAQGMEFVPFSDGMKAEFKSRTQSLVDAFETRVAGSKEIIDAYLADVGKA